LKEKRSTRGVLWISIKLFGLCLQVWLLVTMLSFHTRIIRAVYGSMALVRLQPSMVLDSTLKVFTIRNEAHQLMPQLASGLVESEEKSVEKRSVLERLTSLWEDGLLFAVPKRKVSVFRRKKRNYFKHFKVKTGFKQCETCKELHMRHHLCPFCFPKYSSHLATKANRPFNEDSRARTRHR